MARASSSDAVRCWPKPWSGPCQRFTLKMCSQLRCLTLSTTEVDNVEKSRQVRCCAYERNVYEIAASLRGRRMLTPSSLRVSEAQTLLSLNFFYVAYLWYRSCVVLQT